MNKGAKFISGMMMVNTTITALSVSGKSIRIIYHELEVFIVYIFLFIECNIGIEGNKALSGMLMVNSTLLNLDIGSMKIKNPVLH